MASVWVNILGEAKWAKVYEPDNFMNQDKWKLNIYPQDEAEWAKYTKAGIQKERKTDEDGDFFGTDRATWKMIKGDLVHFAPPAIYNSEGHIIVDYINTETGQPVTQFKPEEKSKIARRGTPVLIGNGSKVKVNICVYDTQKGKGQRLESVTILDLVEFNEGKSSGPRQVLSEETAPLFSEQTEKQQSKGKSKAKSSDIPW